MSWGEGVASIGPDAIAVAARRCYGPAMDLERIFAGTVIATAIGAGLWGLAPETARAVPAPQTLAVTTTPLPLDRDDPARTKLGSLRFLGAVQLRSTNPLFGGVSGLRAGADGRFLAITDTGNWFAFATIERDGRLVGVKDTWLQPILQEDGKPVTSKPDGDAEALEWDPATGKATVVYEQDHRLAHFSGIHTADPTSLAHAPDSIERLTVMAGWPANGGGEAVALLPGGARLVISETARGPQRSRTALLTEAGKTRKIEIEGIDSAGPDEHAPTDAIALDATRVLILHRRFTLTQGQGAALSLIDLAPVLGGKGADNAVLQARTLAKWEPPLTLDNMEGLALRKEGGRTFLYIVSDDNLNPLQRTLLMKFELIL
jgi:hypothetical protein